MRVLLVTTGTNKVRATLTGLDSIILEVVDVLECGQEGKKKFLSELKTRVETYAPDMLLVWRCPYILSSDIYTLPRYGAFNLHPSLLPEYKGLNPWDAVYGNNEKETGVTLHRISDIADSGEIICQDKFTIAGMDLESAREEADSIAARLVLRFILRKAEID